MWYLTSFQCLTCSMHIENYFIDSPEKRNNRIFKGRFHNRMRAVYEDKKIYAKNICFTPVSQKERPRISAKPLLLLSSPSWARTKDPLINSQML